MGNTNKVIKKYEKDMKTALALSGGGVLGVAHISVLKALDQNNIKINSIAGCSAGALIGALYADGGTAAAEAFISDLEAAGIFNKNNVKFALPSNIFNQVRLSLEKNLKARKFYDLPIKFSCIASDMVRGQMVVLNSGDLIDALMASSAFPGVFSPQKIGDKILVDGGITRNLPAVIFEKDKHDFIIGSSLYQIENLDHFMDKQPNRLTIALRSLDIMQKEMAALEAERCDFVFYPPVDTYSWYNFDKMTEIRQASDDYAADRVRDLSAVMSKKHGGGFWAGLLHD